MHNNNVSGGVSNFNNGHVKTENKTTNHIYLHSGHHSGEFEDWMRTIGGLLQIGSEITHLKPLLELLAAVIAPDRIFCYRFPEIEALQLKPYTEVLLLIDSTRHEQMEKLEGFIKLPCYSKRDVMITLREINSKHPELDDASWYVQLHCREEFLVFSHNPYRLSPIPEDRLRDSYDKVAALFDERYQKALKALDTAKNLLEQEQTYRAYVFVASAIEQIYHAIAYAFDPHQNHYVSTPLYQLREKAATYLPQLFATDQQVDLVVALSVYLNDRTNFEEEYLETHFQDCFQIAEAFIGAVKPCLESKLNYLLSYGKGEESYG